MILTFRALLCLSLVSFVGCATLGKVQRPDSPGMATLEMPITLDLVSINGEPFSVRAARSDPYFHALAPGNYSLEVGYTEYWGSPLAGELVRSDIYKIDLALLADTVYLLQHADPGTKQTLNQRRFRKNFSAWALEPGSGVKTEGRFSREYTGLLGLLTGSYKAAGQSTKEVAVAAPEFAKTESTEVLDQLKHWWQRADKKERGEFLLWTTDR